jgi:hypothetical protein
LSVVAKPMMNGRIMEEHHIRGTSKRESRQGSTVAATLRKCYS